MLVGRLVKMEKIILPSGSVIEIGLLSFEESWKIFQLFSRVVKELDLDADNFSFLNPGEDGVKREFMVQDFFNLKGPICSILSNKELSDAGVVCFLKCTYNGLRIDERTFESGKSRSDFIPCLFYALKENISPFFGNLISSLAKRSEALK